MLLSSRVGLDTAWTVIAVVEYDATLETEQSRPARRVAPLLRCRQWCSGQRIRLLPARVAQIDGEKVNGETNMSEGRHLVVDLGGNRLDGTMC
jgi:cytochrome c-type biogenesis protein CcmH/NrfF